ncbi:hypothetical protein G7Z17_g6837 [Cylindrodendrum hubeiense]|uniref:Uncharacterized protein n=1 Tax=Cylindrodendrum hubeiense TaxID=595255 RepID=A0A9P5LFX7_9HYPO|nr:hypothetical protein G7Z17_g6837 [Cylindrodendrum hubeiense]
MSASDGNSKAQEVSFEIKNLMKENAVSVKDAVLYSGKFFKGSEEHEIPPSEVDKIVIAPGTMESVSSCGRPASPSGTSGDFDLYDGKTKICNVHWEYPWGMPSAEVAIRNYDPKTSAYSVVLVPSNPEGGAIGAVSITISLSE